MIITKSFEEIDALIIRELLIDGRKSFTAIAKEIRTNKEVVWKRFWDMKKSGIINGATIQFNYPCFNFESIATITLSTSSENLKNVLQKLHGIPGVFSFQVYNASFNILVVTTFKNLRDLDNIKTLLKSNPVNRARTHLWTDCRNNLDHFTFGFPEEKMLKPTKKKAKIRIFTEIDREKIDALDYQIVEKLNVDGRKSFKLIGEEIGVSTDTVARRYTKLVRNGFIKVVIQFNPIAIGYKCAAGFFVSIRDRDNVINNIEEIDKIPNVSFITKLTGDFDLEFFVLVRDFEELMRVNKKLAELPGVEKVEVGLIDTPPIWPGPKQYITTF